MNRVLTRGVLTLLRVIPGAEERVSNVIAIQRSRQDVARAVTRLRAIAAANPGRPIHGVLLVEHIGDIIASEPVARWVRRQHPDAFVVWVVKPAFADLVRYHPDVDEVVLVRSLWSIGPIIRAGVFSAFYDLHVNNKPTVQPNRLHAKHWGNPTVDVTNYLDRGSLLEAFTAAAGLPTLSDAPVMHLPPDVKRAIDEQSLPSRFLAIHVRSNDRSRSWPNERWSELIARVSSRWAIPVVEVGLAPPLQPDSPDFRSLCGRLSVAETAEVIRRCSFFIGVDSGPAHMANAWRRPALLLFGRFAGRDDWCPFDGFFAETSDEVILRRVGPLSELSVDEVMTRLDADPRWRSAVTSMPTS